MQIAKQIAGLLTRRGRDAAARDRQEDPRADGLAEGEVPRRLRRERRHARRRGPALEGHGVVAGLLVQQGPLGLLRADRLPHGVAAREPPVRVHGGADLVGDEHEGPRPVLRQRVRRDGDRRAAARRQHVDDRLRRRRREDPLRAERGQERRRRRSARRSCAPARRAAPFERRSGTSPSGSTRRSSTSARSSRSSSAARSTRPAPHGMGMLGVLEQALGYGQKLADRPAARPGLDLRSRLRRAETDDGRGASTHPPISRPASSRRRSCCGSRRRRSASTSRSIRSRGVRDQLRRKTDATPRRARAPARRRGRHGRRDRLRR